MYIPIQREASFDCNVAEFGMGCGYVHDAAPLLAVTRLDYIPLGHHFADGNIPVLPEVSTAYAYSRIALWCAQYRQIYLPIHILRSYLSRLTILLGAWKSDHLRHVDDDADAALHSNCILKSCIFYALHLFKTCGRNEWGVERFSA